MNKLTTLKKWFNIVLTALVASGLLATFLDVGMALAKSVSWNN